MHILQTGLPTITTLARPLCGAVQKKHHSDKMQLFSVIWMWKCVSCGALPKGLSVMWKQRLMWFNFFCTTTWCNPARHCIGQSLLFTSTLSQPKREQLLLWLLVQFRVWASYKFLKQKSISPTGIPIWISLSHCVIYTTHPHHCSPLWCFNIGKCLHWDSSTKTSLYNIKSFKI